MRKSNCFAESLAEVISEHLGEMVEDVVNGMDLTDKISDELPNIEDMVEKYVQTAVDDLDVDDKVADAINEHDFSEVFQEVVNEYDLHSVVSDFIEHHDFSDEFKCVPNVVREYIESDEFTNLVRGLVHKMVVDKLNEVKAKVMDIVKFGPLVRWWKG